MIALVALLRRGDVEYIRKLKKANYISKKGVFFQDYLVKIIDKFLKIS